MRWLNKLVGGEEAEESEAGALGKSNIRLPERWLEGLHAGATRSARKYAADAMLVFHDPVSSDPNFLATLVVFLDGPPVGTTEEFLAAQAGEMESGASSDPDVSSYEVSRVTMPVGDCVRVILVAGEGRGLYYLPTPLGLVTFEFTAPAEEMSWRPSEFDEIVRTFSQAAG